MGLRLLDMFKFFQCGDRFHTLESDVYRRQTLTYKGGPRAERVKVLITSMVVLPFLLFLQTRKFVEEMSIKATQSG